MSSAWSPSTDRRPALDGLRAVAVLAVMTAHGTYGHVKGGYHGVEMFFVLSGFLITTILLAEWADRGRIDFYRFYLRRAARLFPALAVTIIGVYLLYAFGETGVGRHEALLALPKVLLYVGNWFIAAGGNLGYFGHTWSLAIEEQFYLLWPLALLLLLRRRDAPQRIACVALAIAVASIVERAVIAASDVNAAYYRTDTRIGALMVGCALAAILATLAGRITVGRRVARLPLPAVSAAVIVAAVATVDQVKVAAYVVTLPAVIVATAVLIAHIVTGESLLTRLLAVKPAVWIGRRSYGLYLYHFPIFIYITSTRLHSGHVEEVSLRLALTLGVAAASYRFVEAPILRRVRSGSSRDDTPTGLVAASSPA